jgi:hypothetical protein
LKRRLRRWSDCRLPCKSLSSWSKISFTMKNTTQHKSIADYVLSEEFDEKVRRVSAKSRPFDNASSSTEVYAALEKLSKLDEKNAKVLNG